MPPLCLLAVHAHPDDESSKGPGTIAKYHAAGVRTVLVTATGGEEGEILNPAMDRPGIQERIHEVRQEELDRATAIIGYDEVHLLGYRDSGMPGTPANADPRSFAQAPLEEAVGRLVEILRAERPQVIVTYSKDQSGYPHPDHIRVNEISELAFDAAGDPDRYQDLGEPWQPLKLYYVSWSVRRMRAVHQEFLDRGLESPFTDERLARMLDQLDQAELPTTVIDVRGFAGIGREALRAHATQVDPTSKAWFGLPPEMDEKIYPFEEYVLARDLTGSRPTSSGAPELQPGSDGGAFEDDLFAGVAATAMP